MEKRLSPQRAKDNYLAAILESVADGVFTVDKDMRIVSFNRAAQELTGYSMEEALGRPCHAVFKTNICFTTCPVRQAFELGEAVLNREYDILDKNHHKIPISASASVLRNVNGQIVGGVETLRDLSVIHIRKKDFKDKYSFHNLVSRNAAMRRLFGILADVAASEATVLLS